MDTKTAAEAAVPTTLWAVWWKSHSLEQTLQAALLILAVISSILYIVLLVIRIYKEYPREVPPGSDRSRASSDLESSE